MYHYTDKVIDDVKVPSLNEGYLHIEKGKA